jgi:hypothetical protein
MEKNARLKKSNNITCEFKLLIRYFLRDNDNDNDNDMACFSSPAKPKTKTHLFFSLQTGGHAGTHVREIDS